MLSICLTFHLIIAKQARFKSWVALLTPRGSTKVNLKILRNWPKKMSENVQVFRQQQVQWLSEYNSQQGRFLHPCCLAWVQESIRLLSFYPINLNMYDQLYSTKNVCLCGLWPSGENVPNMDPDSQKSEALPLLSALKKTFLI